MRFFWLLLVGLCLVAGLVFGALNADEIVLDLYRWRPVLPLGVALLGFALAGALLASLLLWLGVVWPLRRRLARLSRAIVTAPERPAPEVSPPVDPEYLASDEDP